MVISLVIVHNGDEYGLLLVLVYISKFSIGNSQPFSGYGAKSSTKSSCFGPSTDACTAKIKQNSATSVLAARSTKPGATLLIIQVD